MNNSLLGGQECTDYVNIQLMFDNVIYRDRLAIIPRLSFTCSGRITSIRAKLQFYDSDWATNYPVFQVWRPVEGSTMYNKIGEVQLKSDDQLYEVNYYVQIATIILTGNNTIEVQSGDVVGYYHPPRSRYRVTTIQTDGYILHEFSGSHESVYLNNGHNYHQPLLQFTIGK